MTQLEITGMTCGHCKSAVEKALESVPGVTAVEVDLAAGKARVDGDVEAKQLISAVEEEGYQASVAGA